MWAKTKAILVSNDPDTVNQIVQGFDICLPGAELLTANNGTRGISLLKACEPNIVILDASIPDINVWDFFKQASQHNKVPVILLSYSREEADIVKSLETGFDKYIVKPFRQLELMAYIRSILRRTYSKKDTEKVVN